MHAALSVLEPARLCARQLDGPRSLVCAAAVAVALPFCAGTGRRVCRRARRSCRRITQRAASFGMCALSQRMHQGVIREIAKEQAELAEKADCEVCKLSQTRFREPTAAEAAGRA